MHSSGLDRPGLVRRLAGDVQPFGFLERVSEDMDLLNSDRGNHN
jgi:hypothetical protein